jgi:hypothetical protein
MIKSARDTDCFEQLVAFQQLVSEPIKHISSPLVKKNNPDKPAKGSAVAPSALAYTVYLA